MKQNILFIFLLISFSVIGQITVTNETFPVAGDTLRTAVDNMPQGITITAAGADQVWDYSNLTAPFSTELVYKEASEGMAFDELPNATVVVQTAAEAELYYNITDEKIELVGFNGPDPTGFGIVTLVKLDPPTVERVAPLTYPSVQTSEANILVPIGTDLLPDEILNELPLVPDSIRLVINQQRTDFVDAYGSLTIPGGTFDVLRQRQELMIDNKVEALVPILGWLDVTDVILDLVGGGQGIGQDTTITYNFYSNDSKETIASVVADDAEENAVTVTYKFIDVVDNINPVNIIRPGVYAFPNPAINDARFEFTNLNSGDYTLKIYNILGVEVLKKNYFVNGTRTEKVDLSDLRKGTYLYSLIDSKGKTLTTKRLMIIRP